MFLLFGFCGSTESTQLQMHRTQLFLLTLCAYAGELTSAQNVAVIDEIIING